jgi:hypothetical protein
MFTKEEFMRSVGTSLDHTALFSSLELIDWWAPP